VALRRHLGEQAIDPQVWKAWHARRLCIARAGGVDQAIARLEEPRAIPEGIDLLQALCDRRLSVGVETERSRRAGRSSG
jgi:hypothetical protein